MGETGIFPVEGELVAILLTMPTTSNGAPDKSSMSTQSRGDAADSHVERVRSQYDTTDLGSIMGRFYAAVSWRNE